MGLVYLATLVLGLGTLLMQFILSHVGGDADGDHELEAGGDSEFDFDGDMDADADLNGDLSHELGIGHDGDLSHDGDVDVEHDGDISVSGEALGIVLSMRFWTFALMAFGLVGTPMHYFQMAGSVATLLISLAFGLSSGVAAGLTFRSMRKSVSSTVGLKDTVGKMAQVTVPVSKGHIGKVRVRVKGKDLDMLATTDASHVRPGAKVIVVGFRGEEALVEPLETDDDTEQHGSSSAST